MLALVGADSGATVHIVLVLESLLDYEPSHWGDNSTCGMFSITDVIQFCYELYLASEVSLSLPAS